MFGKKCTGCGKKVGGMFGEKNYGEKEPLCVNCSMTNRNTANSKAAVSATKLPTDKSVLYAFVISAAPSDASTGLIGNSVVMMDDDNTIKEKIRANMHSQSSVNIVGSNHWQPPCIGAVSRESVMQQWNEIAEAVHNYLKQGGRSDISKQYLFEKGIAWPRPRSGRCFCIFEVGAKK